MKNDYMTINHISLEKTTELHMAFNLSNKTYAIHAVQIIEIVQLPYLTILEKAPAHIVGVMNLRGTIIGVIDLRKFLGLPPDSYSTEHQVIIISTKNKPIGIIVDSVKDVVQINKDLIEKLPYKSTKNFIEGVYKDENELIALLNINLITNGLTDIELEKEAEDSSLYKNLFPEDKCSLDKLKNRAIKFEKELKVDTDKIDLHENRFVTFCLNNEIYCISLKYIKEFRKIKSVNLTPIPCVPEFIMGLINLRGEFITIIDIKSFLQIKKSRITEKTKIIVVKTHKIQIGIIVDDVFDIINIDDKNIIKNKSNSSDKNKFVSSEVLLNSKIIINILDLEKFLEDERLFVEDAI